MAQSKQKIHILHNEKADPRKVNKSTLDTLTRKRELAVQPELIKELDGLIRFFATHVI